MPTFSTLTDHSILFLLALFLHCLSSFSFSNNPQSRSNPLLFGDAKFITADGGSSSSGFKLTDPNPKSPSASSSGLIIWAKPVKFISKNPVSFSTDFAFSVAPHSDVRFAFVVVSTDSRSKFSGESPFAFSKGSRVFGVEFDNFVDENENVKRNVGVGFKSLEILRVSSDLLNDGSTLRCWIDYDSSSKRLEVRLVKFGVSKPYDPLTAWHFDLGGMWKDEEVLIGLSSSSEKSLQSTVVYSWNFQVRNVPKGLHSQPLNPDLFFNESSHTRNEPTWLHSQPANPKLFTDESGKQEKSDDKKRNCFVAFLSWLLFVIGCGALSAFTVSFLWAVLTRKKEVMVVPSKLLVHPGDIRYEKIDLVLEDRTGAVKS